MPANKLFIKLRKLTGASLTLCREAAEKYPDDEEKALEYIKQKLQARAEKFAGRETKNGIIEVYSHGQMKNIGVMVEVLCQTDFVAKNPEFRKFAHELALQIASMNPLYVSREDIPEDQIESLKANYREELETSGKPAEVIDKIIEGKLEKWYKEVCLLEQEYYRDPEKTISDLLRELSGTLGENIKISRFIRWEI